MVKIPVWAADGRDGPSPTTNREHVTPVLFRHFDPSVLGTLLPCLDTTQFARFLGPAEEVAFVAEDFGGLKRVLADKDAPAAPPGLLRITSAQIDAMTARRVNASHRRIAAYLRDVAPDYTTNISDDDLLYQVQYSGSVGRDLGIKTERAHAQWAFLMVTSKGHVANDLTVTRFICTPGHGPDHQIDAAMGLAMDAARERDWTA